jgi:hypothetical protein
VKGGKEEGDSIRSYEAKGLFFSIKRRYNMFVFMYFRIEPRRKIK